MAKQKAQTKKKKISIAQAAALVAGIIILGIGGMLLYEESQKPRTFAEIMQAVKNEVNDAYAGVYINDSAWFAEMGTGVPVPAPGYKFDVSSRSMPTLYFSLGADPGQSKQVRHNLFFKRTVPAIPNIELLSGEIVIVMDKAGFTLEQATDDKAIQFIKDDKTCVYTTANGVVSFSCSDPAAIAQAAKQAQPLVEGYTRAKPGLAGVTIGPVVIKSQNGAGVIGSSKTAGYDIAEAVVAVDGKSSLVLYYNKDNGPWQYIAQAGDEYGFYCKDYTANADVRKALYDQICIGDDGHRRLDTNNRALQ